MFDIGSHPARTCAGVSRRSFLRLAVSAPLALGLGRGTAGRLRPARLDGPELCVYLALGAAELFVQLRPFLQKFEYYSLVLHGDLLRV